MGQHYITITNRTKLNGEGSESSSGGTGIIEIQIGSPDSAKIIALVPGKELVVFPKAHPTGPDQFIENTLAISKLVQKSVGKLTFSSGYSQSKFGLRVGISENRFRPTQNLKTIDERSAHVRRTLHENLDSQLSQVRAESRRLEFINEAEIPIKVVVEPWLCEFDISMGDHLYLVDNRENEDPNGLHLVFHTPNYIVVHNFSRLLWPFLNGQRLAAFCSEKESPFPMYDLLERQRQDKEE